MQTPATCQSAAIYHKSCVCGAFESDGDTFTYGSLGNHVYDQQVANATFLKEEANCQHGTLYYKSCVCGVFDDQGESFAQGEPTATHTPADAVRENEVPATCQADGSYDEVVYCSICDEELSSTPKTIPSTGDHVENEEFTVENEVESTCSEEGTYDAVFTCKYCNVFLRRETRKSDTKAHDYESSTERAATCESNGLQVRTCKDCGFTERKTLSQLSHSYANGECTACQAKESSVGLGLTASGDGSSYVLSGLGSCSDSTVYIPATYGGKPVTSIAENAFKDNTDIIAIYFSSNITSIGANAFYGCTNLEKIVFSSSITSIGNSAFYNCTSLEAINLPDSVQTVGTYAFYNCLSVTKIVIGEGVTSLGSGAFYNCKNLQTLEFNAIRCSTISISNPHFYAAGQESGGVDMFVGENCELIPSYLFYGDTFHTYEQRPLLKSIYFPDNGKCAEIQQYAFKSCFVENMTVYIPAYVTTIGQNAFGGSYSFTSSGVVNEYYADVTLLCAVDKKPDGWHSQFAYSGDSVVLSGGVYSANSHGYSFNATRTVGTTNGYRWLLKKDGTYAIYGVDSHITEAIFPELINGNYVTEIVHHACVGNHNLTKVVIPRYVTLLGDGAFKYCTAITQFEFRATNCKDMNRTAFDIHNSGTFTMLIGKNVTRLPAYFLCLNGGYSSCTSIVFEKGSVCEEFANYSLYNCRMQSIVIPASVQRIGYSCFSSAVTVYYGGAATTEDDEGWNAIEIGSSNDGLNNATFYYYCEGTPTQNGSYWTYDENGEPTIVEYVPTEGSLSQGLTYTLSADKKHYIVSMGNCTDTEIYISETYNGLPVKEIKNSAFYGQTAVTKVHLPDSIEIIGSQAFYNTAFYNDENNWEDGALYIGKHLVAFKTDVSGSYTVKEGTLTIAAYAFNNATITGISLPTSLKYIGEGAFQNCTALTGTVRFPATQKEVLRYTFKNCYVLEEIILPEGITTIGDSAFYRCRAVTTFALPSTVTSVAPYAFYECLALETVNIPEGVTELTNYLFSGCTALKNVTLPSTLRTISSTNVFYNCSALTDIVIPNNVTSLPNGLFKGCTSLVNIELPLAATSWNNYQLLGYVLFNGTSYSTKVVQIKQYYKDGSSYYQNTYIPKSLRSVKINGGSTIPYGYFDGLTMLESVTLGDSIHTIYDYAFRGCTNLKSVKLPANLTAIRFGAFYGCTGLSSIELPEMLESIGGSAFSGCVNLTSITIPQNVTTISDNAFKDCVKLKEVQNLSELDIVVGSTEHGGVAYYAVSVYGEDGESAYVTTPDGFKFISDGENAVLCDYVGEATELQLPALYNGEPYAIGDGAFYNRSDITAISIPEGILSIGSYAFYGCTAMSGTVTMPATQTVVKPYTFYNCNALNGVVLAATTEQIGDYAFYGCSALTEVIIPETITKIGTSAYDLCTGVTSLQFLAENCVNSSSYTPFASLGTAGEGVAVVIGNKVATLPNRLFYASTYAPAIKSVTFAENSICEAIPEYAFCGCAKLESIVLPESITSIGNAAFNNCSILTSLVIPSSVSSLPSGVLQGCGKLEELTIPFVGTSAMATSPSTVTLFGVIFGNNNTNTVKVTQKYADNSSVSYRIPSSLKKVTVTGGSLLYGAFYGCTMLEEIYLDDSIVSLPHYAFYGCSKLSTLSCGTINYFGSYLFSGCTSLKEFAYGGTMEDWLTADFAAQYSNPMANGMTLYVSGSTITELVVPESITEIKPYAFFNCATLSKVYLHENVASIGNNAFLSCYKLLEVFNGSSLTLELGATTHGCIAQNAMRIYDSVTAESDFVETEDKFVFLVDGDDCSLINYAGTATEIVLPNGYNGGSYRIADKAFAYNTTLKSVTMQGGVSAIGNSAFLGCTALESVYIPTSVATIGESVFSGCGSLKEMTIPYIGASADETALIRYPFGYLFGTASFTGATQTSQSYKIKGIENTNRQTGKYYIPNSIAKVTVLSGQIPQAAFENYSYNNSTELILADDVTYIDTWAFNIAKGLTKVTIGSGVQNILKSAFLQCTYLTSVTIGENVTSIADYAFSQCKALTEITIPAKVTSIGLQAFYNCSLLTSVTFENTENWWYSAKTGSTSGTALSSTDMGTPATAATYLTTTYSNKYLGRTATT